MKSIFVIMSKDRAMQLNAMMSSFRKHCLDIDKISKYVIYKTTSKIHKEQYKYLQRESPDFIFIEETSIVEQICNLCRTIEYFSIQVDDNIYISDFIVSEAITILQNDKNILGYSYRLGSNITYCYMLDRYMNQPDFIPIENQHLSFNWIGQNDDFGYPLECSSSLYRTRQILPFIFLHKGASAQMIEAYLDTHKKEFVKTPLLACPTVSKVMSIPVNEVSTMNNRIGVKYRYTSDELATKFSLGERIDIQKLEGFIPNAPHVEVEFSFIKGTL